MYGWLGIQSFQGQSTAGVTLGGMRVANDVLHWKRPLQNLSVNIRLENKAIQH